MPSDLAPETWAQIRQDYEHSQRPVDEICAEHGISPGTLRNRVRRWGWTRRRAPIPLEGPPPSALPPPPRIQVAAPPCAAGPDAASPSPPASPQGETGAPCPAAAPPMAAESNAGELDGGAIVPHLQGAVGRLLPAIDATVARLAAGPMHAREMEQAARALAALTRTLRELNALLSQRQAAAAAEEDKSRDLDELRYELARRMRALIDERTGQTGGAGAPDGTAAVASCEE